jgi:hypothetical protein
VEWIWGFVLMNQFINYLHSRLGKRTCPIVSIERVHSFSVNSPFWEWFVITLKDGTKIELIEKPKFKGE